MGKVIFNNSISLDGFVAGPNDNPDNGLGDGGMALFDWYFSGDVPFQMEGDVPAFKVSQASADYLLEWINSVGAMVAGRRMFDIAGAWGGNPPGGGPCFILTHNPPREWLKEGSPFTFVTDGIESAIRQAKAAAGGKDVAIGSASIAQQCLRAGLLDEIRLDIAPVLLGSGVRLFENLGEMPVKLEIIHVIDTPAVTHVGYRVVKK